MEKLDGGWDGQIDAGSTGHGELVLLFPVSQESFMASPLAARA